MNTLSDIIKDLINEDTQTLSDRAIEMVRRCSGDTPKELQDLGIILLAVTDAKKNEYPSSTLHLYKEAFYATKELMGGVD